MAKKKQATERWNRIPGEPAGTKGLVNDFLFPQGRSREHREHEEEDHRSRRSDSERTHGAV